MPVKLYRLLHLRRPALSALLLVYGASGVITSRTGCKETVTGPLALPIYKYILGSKTKVYVLSFVTYT